MLVRKLFALVRDYQRVVADLTELNETYERLLDWRADQAAGMNAHIVYLQAANVDNQRAIRSIAIDAREALLDGVDIVPELDQLIEFTNASIANLEEHLDVTSVNDL